MMTEQGANNTNIGQEPSDHILSWDGLLAFGLGSGLSPFAPGTMGSLLAIPLCLALRQLGLPAYVLAFLAMTVLGIWICDRVGKRLGKPDQGAIVWDEIAGMALAMMFIPITWQWVVASFCLFRLFDIWKPWPISLAESRFSGGLGVMLDDLIAGLFTLGILWLAAAWLI